MYDLACRIQLGGCTETVVANEELCDKYEDFDR